MKTLLMALAVLGLLVYGCVSQPQAPPGGNDLPPPPPAQGDDLPPPPPSDTQGNLASEGQPCAGTQGTQCQQGLQCVTSGAPNAEGTCTAPGSGQQELQTCPTQRYSNCVPENSPVCGRTVSNDVTGYRDYSGPCEACSTSSNAIGYYMGTCEQKGW